MKKIQNILLGMLCCGLLGSCNYALDLDPITQQTEKQFYRTEDDAFQAMTAVYDVLEWSAPKNQNCPFELVSEQLGDCCYGGGGNANDVPFVVKMSRWQMDPNDPTYGGLWYKYYAGIYRANVFLQKIQGIEFKKEADKNQMIAEVRFLRGNFYFDLVRLFGNVPLILEPLEPGSYYTQMQEEASVIYRQIREDMEFAVTNGLPEKVVAGEAGRITKYAAEAMLARVWLYYTGAYGKTDLEGLTKTQIIAYIEDVVNNSGADLMENYADIFKVANKNNKESIFEIQYTSKGAWGDWNYREGSDGNQAVILWAMREPSGDSPYASGWSFAPVRASLWDEFDQNDSRRGASLINMETEGFSYTPGYQNTGIFNKKYTALKENEPTDGSRELNFPNNYICIRFADVLLMAAELELETNAGNAQRYYERVVKRAMGNDYSVPAVTLPLILRERLLELALEGHRYWDLRRQGLDAAKTAIEKENATVGEEFKKTFDLKYQGLMPIPQTQITLCKQLKQNAGY